MPKTLIIKTIDGRSIERDITSSAGIPFGEPATSEVYAQICAGICQMGYTDVDKINSKHYVHLPISVSFPHHAR